MESKEETTSIQLKYGDIIEIISPTNDDYHQNNYFIEYIDNHLLEIVNVSSMMTSKLKISQNKLTDESITEIHLLNRSETDGYAKQNYLNTHTWLDIYIGGDIPVIITGEITNLEEDMIEVTTFPEKDVIYIDFAYKGIPRDIPFKKFIVREKPPQSFTAKDESVETTSDEEFTSEGDVDMDSYITEDGEMIINTPENAVPDENIRDVLKDMYNDANDIIFGEELDDIVQNVEIPESQRKYGIEIQANDMMDELLSTIPDHKRTSDVKNNISLLINRFKELRQDFSKFDDNENVNGYVKNGPLWKPLIERLKKLNKNIKWIIPVVEQRKYLYFPNDSSHKEDDFDAILYDQHDIMSREKELYKMYKNNTLNTNTNRYFKLYEELDAYNRTFDTINKEESLVNNATVQTEFDAVINNLQDFYSSVVNKSNIIKKKFVIQRYNMGLTKQDNVLMKSGKTIYIRNNMTPNDSINIKSLLLLPPSVVELSKVSLPYTNILKKSHYSQTIVSLFRLLRTNINSITIDDLEHEFLNGEDYDDKKEYEMDIINNNTIKEFSLDERFKDTSDKYDKFLNVIIPKTRTLIKQLRTRIKNRYSIHDFVCELEPFLIYNDDLSYQQYKELRYTIKNAIMEFNKNLINKSETLQKLSESIPVQQEQISRIEMMFFNNPELLELFKDGYKINDVNGISQSELLNKLIINDNITMLSDIITKMTINTLTTPEQLLNGFQPGVIEDEGEIAKIKPKDCIRRYLTKKYNAISDLQDDNGNEDIFYDVEYDDTPYDILDLYAKEQKEMEPALFKEFLEENLVQKHDVQQKYAGELAETIISGKKQIKEGEYAVLELKPGLGKDVDETLLTPQEKKMIEIEKETRKKQGYYLRKGNQWIFDKSVDPEMFIDTNELFCNIQSECSKNLSNKSCENVSFSKKRIDNLNKARMLREFDNRIDISLETLEENIKKELMNDFRIIKKTQMLDELKTYKHNNFAFEYGKTSDETIGIISEFQTLRDAIMSLDDFVKKQSCIIRLVDNHCREPMTEMQENMNWFYCRNTNTPLIPISIEKLAREFVLNPFNYGKKLDEICASYGTMNDDGDAVVDKYSGYVLKKIDFVMQETYNEEGFVIQTHDIMEKDIGEELTLVMSKQKRPTFENDINEIIYNVGSTLSVNIGIKFENIQDFVIRLTNELLDANLKNEIVYNDNLKLLFEKKGKKGISYEIYKSRYILWCIASSLLVAIQTSIPSYRSTKTFKGCKRSFSGFPLTGGVEDKSGIEYIACVMYNLKSSIKPWNSIEKLKRSVYVEKILETLEKLIENRPDINELYSKKRKYIIDNPEQSIPDEHSIEKWKHYLPPVVKYKLSRVEPLSRDFERTFMDSIKKGHSDQIKYINTIHSKASLLGLSLINHINDIIKKEEPLLKTASNIPFLENGCCIGNNTRSMEYFIEKEPTIKQLLTSIHSISELISETKEYSKAPILHNTDFTGIKHIIIKEQILDEHIYAFFIKFCNFDNDLPTPNEYKVVSGEKLEDFPQNASIDDKIEFMKKNGKRYTLSDLNTLLTIIHKDKIVTLNKVVYFNQIDVMYDILDYLDTKDSEIIEENFRRHLRNVLKTYKKGIMVSEVRDELKDLKNYLFYANKNMFKNIMNFVKEFGNLTKVKFERFQESILGIYSNQNTSKEQMINNITHIENIIYYFTKVYPDIILSGKTHTYIPKHWGLSAIHENDLVKILDNQWNGIMQFHGDKTLTNTLRTIIERTNDLHKFMVSMPKSINIHKMLDNNGTINETIFYSLFDNDAIGYLYGYMFLSVLHEYISCANDTNMLNADIELKKQKQRDINDELHDMSSQTRAVDTDDFREELLEVEIKTTDSVELKERVASVLILFLEIQEKQKNTFMSYEEISAKIHKAKVKEKQKIVTQDLGKLDNDVRKVEDLLKKYKMGRWNIGLQKGLVHYDKDNYDRERLEMEEDELIDEDVDDLEAHELEHISNEYDNEGTNINQLGQDYMDGNYYNEIPEEREFGDE